jgi:hypothetical protein
MTDKRFPSKNKTTPKGELQPYSDEELELTPSLEEKIEKLMQFFDQSGIEYHKFNKDHIPQLDLDKKKAYPNYDQYMYIPGQHDTHRWLEAVKTVYYKEKQGVGRMQAIRQVVGNWNKMEAYDFLNWLRYHESGDHMKYKTANLWYENDSPGYFLHVKKDPEPIAQPQVSGQDIDAARDSIADDLTAAEKKSIIEKQRQKIVGRLDSAEKLMRSHEGQVFAGKEFEALLDAIYQLKKRVQMVNKISTSTRLYDDMIVREANILTRQGFVKAAEVLYSVAQANNPPPAGLGTDSKKPLTATPPAPPGQGSGSAGGLPSVGPGMPQNPPESAPNENSAVDEFLKNLETGNVTTDDKSQVEDSLEVEDVLNVADEELLVTEAQAMPPGGLPDVPITDTPAPSKPTPAPPPKAPIAPDEPLEVSEEDLPPPKKETDQKDVTTPASNFNARMDSILSEVTLADIVAELEDISKVYKVRELPRRLARVDMMMDSVGISSFFPGLSEATNKSLESNNYISTRLEDILSKLRGSMATKEIDLKGEGDVEKPELAGLKNNLKTNEEKEKARKQMRKDQETAELTGNEAKETPEVEIEEDLGPKAPPPPAARPPVPKPPV